jgi:cell division protein FtsW
VFVALILKEPIWDRKWCGGGADAVSGRDAGEDLGMGLLASMPGFITCCSARRRARMLAYLNPEADPRGTGFHILQSLIAVGTGGPRGLGLTGLRAAQGSPLPEPHTFIYANV